ncbi:MAG: hypothetical protein IK025_12250 [Bacteroidales bacterium]|nr:hypothetical protein [Bacteroidales bacterium]
MRRFLFIIVVAILFCLSFSSCHVSSNVMREPNVRFEFNSNDITLSEQFSAEATTIKVLGINWKRLFKKSEDGYINNASIPILGSFIDDQTVNEAMYKLMEEHPGYDVVVYPQYHKYAHKPVLGTNIYSKTTVKVTARLGKLK